MIYVNPAFERLTGYSGEEVVGRRFGLLAGPDTDPAQSLRLRTALNGGEPVGATLRSYRKDGSAFWNEARITPVTDSDGSPIYFLALLNDVSEAVEGRQRLERAERRYRSLVEHLPMVTYVAERTNRARLTYVSPQIEAWTGHPQEAWLGDSDLWLRSLHPDDRERLIDAERRRVDDGWAEPIEYRLLTAAGETIWVRDRDTGAGVDGGPIEGLVENITEERESAGRLRQEAELRRSVLEALSEGVIAIEGGAGTALDFNPAALRILGLDAEQLHAGEWWLPLQVRDSHGRPLPASKSPGTRVLRTGEPVHDRRVSLTRAGDGKQRQVSINYEPLRGVDGGHPDGVVVSFRDVTELQRSLEELRQFAALTELSSDFVAIADRDNVVTYVNAAGRELVGLDSLEQATDRPVDDYLSPEGQRLLREVEMASVAEHGRWEGESKLQHFNTGAEIDVRGSSFLVRHPETGRHWATATVRRDITEQKRSLERLRRSQQRFEAQYRGNPVPTYSWRRIGDDFELIDCNEAAATATEGRLTQMLGRRASEFLADDPEIIADFERCFSTQKTLSRAYSYRMRSTGQELNLVVTYVPIEEDLLLVHALDVTERVEFERRLREQAEHDGLTGLSNRRHFEATLEQLTGAAGAAAIVIVDVDHFKFVNDSLGHAAGDGVLRAVAEALRTRARDEDLVARLGGDEFAILLADADQQRARAIAGHLLGAIRSRTIGVAVTASAGVAAFDPSTEGAGKDALVAADIALYQAKQAGRDRVATYGGRPGENLAWLEQVRGAIAAERFTLHAQPWIDLATGGVIREELLIRMLGEDGKIIPPGSFLPTAERFGLIREIDRWVVERGIERAAAGHPVAINLSARSLSDLELPAFISERLTALGADPANLAVEFTETAAVSSLDEAREFTQQLREIGCSSALDDFGTGFGSLVLLKHLPVDYLKIDMEFVRKLATTDADQQIVRSVVNLAAEAGMMTIAEGVEDEGALALLRQYGVDYAQGFHLARPAPIEDLDE